MRKTIKALAILTVIFLVASCTQYVFIPIYDDNTNSTTNYTASEIARAIPENVIARMGLSGTEDDTYKVERNIEPATETHRSSIALQSGNERNLVAKIWLNGYIYNRTIFTTQEDNPIIVTYPLIKESSTAIIETYRISADSISVEMPNAESASTVSVAISGEITSATKPSITENGTVITISDIPDADNFEAEISNDNGYVVDGENISVADAAGMTGTEAEPYMIGKLSDVAAINSLIEGQVESHFILTKDLTLTTEWIYENMLGTNISGAIEPRPIQIPSGKTVYFDFNGYTITFKGIPGTVLSDALTDEVLLAMPYTEIQQYTCTPFIIREGGTMHVSNGSANSIEKGHGGFVCTDSLTGIIFKVEGNLTVNGGYFETVGDTKQATITVASTGTLTFNNGTLYCSSYNGAIENSGNAIVNDGYFYTNSNSQYGSKRFKYCFISDGMMTINGGEVYGIQGGVSAGMGTLIINDVYSEVKNKEVNGQMTSADFYAVYAAGERGVASCTINGGTFISDTREAVHIGNSVEGDGGINDDADAVINGGTFESCNAEYDIYIDYPLGNAEIAGGKFKHNKISIKNQGVVDFSDWLNEKHQLIENADGWYEVTEK